MKYQCSSCLCVFDKKIEKCPHCNDSDILELNEKEVK